MILKQGVYSLPFEVYEESINKIEIVFRLGRSQYIPDLSFRWTFI